MTYTPDKSFKVVTMQSFALLIYLLLLSAVFPIAVELLVNTKRPEGRKREKFGGYLALCQHLSSHPQRQEETYLEREQLSENVAAA